MMKPQHRKMSRLAVFVLANALCLCVGMGEERIEELELRAALDASLKQNKELKSENAKLIQVNVNLRDSLMASNAESEEFRKSYANMRLQLEALGIEAVTEGDKGVEGRLLKAMNDIRLLEEDKMRISEALINLSDKALQVIEQGKEGEQDSDELNVLLSSAVDNADKSLGIGGNYEVDGNVRGTIHEAKIIGVKDDYGMVVFNVGRVAGAKIGMPFRLFRKDRPVGNSIVVDVRDNVSAALIKKLNKEDDYPKVGDLASVATTE
ncbi:hypothetical protein OAF65_10170 [Verrucomicrobiales bacterium]|nr:hypothetical protein [Verrucomicrobiales bacterium]